MESNSVEVKEKTFDVIPNFDKICTADISNRNALLLDIIFLMIQLPDISHMGFNYDHDENFISSIELKSGNNRLFKYSADELNMIYHIRGPGNKRFFNYNVNTFMCAIDFNIIFKHKHKTEQSLYLASDLPLTLVIEFDPFIANKIVKQDYHFNHSAVDGCANAINDFPKISFESSQLYCRYAYSKKMTIPKTQTFRCYQCGIAKLDLSKKENRIKITNWPRYPITAFFIDENINEDRYLRNHRLREIGYIIKDFHLYVGDQYVSKLTCNSCHYLDPISKIPVIESIPNGPDGSSVELVISNICDLTSLNDTIISYLIEFEMVL
jgi:hypothetical protein